MKGRWTRKLLSFIVVVSMLASQGLPILASAAEPFPEETALADAYDREFPDLPLDETIPDPLGEAQGDVLSGENESAADSEELPEYSNEEPVEHTAGDSSETLAEDAKPEEDTSAESDRAWTGEDGLAGALEGEIELGGGDSPDHEELFKIEKIEISGTTVNVQYSVKLNCLLELGIYEDRSSSDDLRYDRSGKIKVYLELDHTRSEASFDLSKSKGAVEDYYQFECPVLCEAGEDAANSMPSMPKPPKDIVNDKNNLYLSLYSKTKFLQGHYRSSASS